MKELFRILKYIGGVFGLVAIILIVTDFEDILASFKTPVDLYDETVNFSDLGEGDLICTDFDCTLGCAATLETTTKKSNGTITGRKNDNYYIVPVYDGDTELYICIEIYEKNQSLMNKIESNTYDFLTGEADDLGDDVYTTYGVIKKADSDLFKYMKSYMEEDLEWFEEGDNVEDYVMPYYVHPIDVKATKLLFIGALIVALIGIACVVSLIYRFFAKPAPKLVKINGMDLAQAKDIVDNWKK